MLVGLHGEDRRSGAVLRVDLPPPEVPARVREHLAADMARALREAGSDAVIALVLSEAAMRHPRPPVRGTLQRVLPRAGLEVADVVGVTEDAYRSLLCEDPRC